MYAFERYLLVRDLVKDPNLTAKEIAKQTGYVVGYVNQLRSKFKDQQQFEKEAKEMLLIKEQKEQARINKLINKAVKQEREKWVNQGIPIPLLVLYQDRHELTIQKLNKLIVACNGVINSEGVHAHAKHVARLVISDTQNLITTIS